MPAEPGTHGTHGTLRPGPPEGPRASLPAPGQRHPRGAGLFGFAFIYLVSMIYFFSHYFAEAPAGVGGSASVLSLRGAPGGWGHKSSAPPSLPAREKGGKAARQPGED